jgi:hypothetical protein
MESVFTVDAAVQTEVQVKKSLNSSEAERRRFRRKRLKEVMKAEGGR